MSSGKNGEKRRGPSLRNDGDLGRRDGTSREQTIEIVREDAPHRKSSTQRRCIGCRGRTGQPPPRPLLLGEV